MKVLVACEFSGVVRRAFRAMGHEAWSCDLLPAEDLLVTEGGAPHHIHGDVRDIIASGWDMMIAHPPCTHLAVSGARHFAQKRNQQWMALGFVWRLLFSSIPRVCLENPVGIISSRIRKPDQIIQPYQFGEDASKKTCLWLRGLPKLQPTSLIAPRTAPDGKPRWANQTDSGQNRLGPSDDRWMKRSRTYEGIANAMAAQWGAS